MSTDETVSSEEPVSTEEFVRYQHVVELPGLVISDALFQQFHFQPHFHLDYHIGVVTSGIQRQRISGNTQDIRPGMLCLMPPGQVHDGASPDDRSHQLTTFRVPPALINEILFDSQDKVSQPNLAPTLLENPSLYQAFLRLRKSFHHETCASQLYKDSLWTLSLNQLLAGAERQVIQPEQYRLSQQQGNKVRDYCEANLNCKITLNTLAGLCNLSRFQFIRSFQKQTGLAPHSWLMRLRLEHACASLSSPDALIADIAAEVGFYDQSHFNRAFKVAYGVTPSQYRMLSTDRLINTKF
ncbi:hypothetical protein BTA51_14740 [Hahella sp. CCB-MM4]|uniref:AraC family transcriptional regulator n=1 Tax=Hahella sp. (strain CCB-MM4) TaxID=1926491 RepID=UPI000BC83837|nr:AraC family transcriptional regulator [Hahella sp. CCB-MM4]OZG72775.1 hypothetical protein BTA51_14740 [Hahella sp. CCB-MM4]